MNFIEQWLLPSEIKAIDGDVVNFHNLHGCNDEFKTALKAALDNIDSRKYWNGRPEFRLGTPDWNVVVEITTAESLNTSVGREKFHKSNLAGWRQDHRLSEHVVLVLEVGDTDRGKGRKMLWRLLIDESIWIDDSLQSLWGDMGVRNYAAHARRKVQSA